MMTNYGCGDLTVEQCHRIGYSPGAQLPRQFHDTYRNAYSRPQSVGRTYDPYHFFTFAQAIT